ncbi:N-acetylmuramoyl-L-alanine amidase [Corynebacterium sp. TAE3-ERU12]|nr:N-acetylmuramoyl-L-alanine amidase [Corynebacterium sp. TAE3-ERU12]
MWRTAVLPGMVALLAVLGLTACTIGDVEQPNSTSSTTSAKPTSTTQAHKPAPDKDNPLASLAGATISIDPGHAGTAPPASDMVTDGRGGVKQCNTTGTASNSGWPEHTFNWQLTMRMKQMLEDAGATVLLSRQDDENRAPCIDQRAWDENDSDADAVVSIHADGAAPQAQGFHIAYIADPLPNNLPEESKQLAVDIRDAMSKAGFMESNYLGAQGLWPRADLTGLNLSTRPKVLVECGNMRNDQDAAMLQSAEGQQRLADAIVAGIATFLRGSN